MSKPLKKKPWVPPPGKTTKNKKIVPTRSAETVSSVSIYDVDMKEDSSPTDYSGTKRSFGSSTTEAVVAGYPYLEMQILKKELKLMKQHCHFLKSVSDTLYRSVKVLCSEKRAVRDLISQADDHITEFVNAFYEIEGHMLTTETDENVCDARLDVYLFLSQEKELLLTKMLQSYESMVSVLRFVLEEQENSDITILRKEQENYKKSLKSLEELLLSRQRQIENLQVQLSISQEQVDALKKLKASLEETRAVMQRELISRESQIDRLNVQISKLSVNETSHGNEKIIEIIENLKEKSKAEKEALKKALRIQKTRADQNEEIVLSLQVKLSEREQIINEISEEKSQLEVQLVALASKLVDLESQLQQLKMDSLNLQSLKNESEASHLKEVQSLQFLLEEKSKSLNIISEENSYLKKSQSSLEEKFVAAENDLKSVQQKYKEFKETFHIQSENVKKDFQNNEEIKALSSLLNEIKEQLASEKDNRLVKQNIVTVEHSDNDFLLLAKEIKEQLVQAKEAYQHFSKDHSQSDHTLSMEKELNELKKKYELALEEKQHLQVQVESLEKDTNSKRNLTTNKEKVYEFANREVHFPMDANFERRFSLSNEQETLKLLQKEVSELREEIRRQESQNNLKMTTLEEELKLKNAELSSFEKKKQDEQQKLLIRIKELQENFDRTNMNYESLQRYVNILKSSYSNVFGVP